MSGIQCRALVLDAVAQADGCPLNEAFLPVIGARDARALDAEIQSFVSDSGFGRHSVVVIHDDFSRADSCVIVGGFDNTPSEFLEEWSCW